MDQVNLLGKPPPDYLAGFAIGLSSLAVSVRIGLNIPQMNEYDWWYYYGG